MMHLKRLAALAVILSIIAIRADGQQNYPSSAATTAPPLSAQALDALVAGIALYPDQTVEHALAASVYPEAIHQAGAMSDALFHQYEQNILPSIRYLRYREPELLKQMDQHLSFTARLGLAAVSQLEDVWAAIDRVREEYAASAAQYPQGTTPGSTSTTSGGTYGAPVHGAFAAGLLADEVLEELSNTYHSNGTATYIGPNGGVATGSGQSVIYQNGATTVVAGAGSTTVYGPNGTTAQLKGQAVAGATTLGDTTYYGSTASGSVSTSSGQYATGSHSGLGTATSNPDGSTSFSRDGSTSVSSNAGSTTVHQAGSGTVTGDGSGSYQGSTEINSTHGDATLSTQASGGQVSTTVITDTNQQTFTAGDGNVEHLNATAGSNGTARTQSRTTNPTPSGRTQRSPNQLNTHRPSSARSPNDTWLKSLDSSARRVANQSMSQSWNQLNSLTTQFSSRGANPPSFGRSPTSRPTGTGTTGSRARSNLSKPTAPSRLRTPGSNTRNAPTRTRSSSGRRRR